MAKKNCPYCSNPIYDNARRCPFCGRNLDFELARKLEKQKADQEKFNRTVKLSILAFMVLAFSAAAILWTAEYSPIGSHAKLAATQTADALNFCNPDEVRKAAGQLIDYNDRWADIMALAVSVDRDSLVIQVDRLQTIRRDARDVEIPDCMNIAKTSLTDGMETHIQGLLAYLHGDDMQEVNKTITTGNLEMNTFADEVERLQRCAPDCW